MNTLRKHAVLFSAAFLLAAIPALAQDENGVKFEAPFAFQVQEVSMPAGRYTATQPDINVPVLLVQDADGSHAAFVTYTPLDEETPQATTQIGFKKFGNLEFMDRITIAEENLEIQLSQSKAEERAAENTIASEDSLPATSVGTIAGDSADPQAINGSN